MNTINTSILKSYSPSHKDMDWGLSSCYLFETLGETAPQMFHNASIWLTLVLATQRYIYICKATRSAKSNLIVKSWLQTLIPQTT